MKRAENGRSDDAPSAPVPEVGQDRSSPATATAYPDGPIIVRGDVEIRVAGVPVERARRTVALCRCGGSTIKPFCDGTHKVTGFCTPHEQALCRELVEGQGVEYEDLARSFDGDDPSLAQSA